MHCRYEIENKDTRNEVCALKWNTMMDDNYWASAVEMWQGNTIMPYSKPVIPLRQSAATSSDYQLFGNYESYVLINPLTAIEYLAKFQPLLRHLIDLQISAMRPHPLT